MSCADDPIPLTDEIVASRAARLAVIAENTAKRHLVLVILFMLLAQKSPFLVALLKSLIPLR